MNKNFLDVPGYYKIGHSESRQSGLQRKVDMFEKYTPGRWRLNIACYPSNLQYVYSNYKNKCHHGYGGPACGKSHTHDREVVSDHCNAYKGFLKLVARAIRIVKM